MEWSKAKTMKLIELMQENPTLWNSSLCDTRKDKQKRKNELHNIANILEITASDAMRKIQHLRTQYNREWAREVRSNEVSPDEPYVSGWYAYEYVHFLKYSTKPYRVIRTQENSDKTNNTSTSEISDYKLDLSPARKIQRTDSSPAYKPETNGPKTRDNFSVFGEYIANELRSLKTEKNQLIAKKKILDVLFEIKIGTTCETSAEHAVCTDFDSQRHSNSIHSDKGFPSPSLSAAHIEPLTPTHSTTSGISDIIINNPCHYQNFKVDTQ